MPGPTQNPNPFECSICQKKFSSQRSRDLHVLVVHQNAGRFKCGHCGKTFWKKSALGKHAIIHTGKMPFGCEICQKRFNSKGNLRTHHLDNHSEKKFKCETCGMAFGRECKLQVHLKSHSEEKPSFACPVCQKSFSTKSYMNVHVLTIHENAGCLKCGHCHKTFQNKKMLEKHERVHTGEKPFSCKICEKEFKQEHHLKDHHLDKHAEKKFKCETCGMAFGREYGLKVHLVVHSTGEPFQCELCPRRYARKTDLKKHHDDHHSGRKFKCETCGKDFGSKRALKSHLSLIHSEDRFQCEDCPNRFFASKKLFSKHRLYWHQDDQQDERFRCDKCENSYKHIGNLKKHLKSHSTTQRGTSGQGGSVQEKRQKELGTEIEQPDSSDGSADAENSLRIRRKTPNYQVGQDDVEAEESSEGWSTGSSESDFQDSGDETSESEESTQEDEDVGDDWEANTSDDPTESSQRIIKREHDSRASGEEEEQNDVRIYGDEIPTERVKTVNLALDGDVQATRDPIESSQRGIKRERDSDGQAENDEPNKKAAPSKKPKGSKLTPIPNQRTIFDCYGFKDLIRTNQSRMKEECRAKSDDPAGVGQSRIKRELDLASQIGNRGHLASLAIDLSSDESDEDDGEQPLESNTVTSANLKVVYDVEYKAPE